MNAFWQDVLVLTVVGACGLWIARRIWRTLVGGKRFGCGSCGSCSSEATNAATPPTVPLEIGTSPVQSRKQD